MSTREQVITSMCYTWRHDYGIVKDPEYKNYQNDHDEINVQFRKLKNSFEDFTKIFKEIKQLNSKPVEQCAIFDASMTAMESVFSFRM